MPETSIVQFHRLITSARLPQRADRSAAGMLPTRAYRYCEAVTSASAFGWWVFPPANLQLLWDGTEIFWHCEALPDWLPLLPSAQFPGFAAEFDAAAPAGLAGCSPPFLTALPEPGLVQIWTGLMARTAPGWNLLVRAPANLPSPGGIAYFEGIVETDRWTGPLFTNIRLTRTNVPIRLRADYPLVQVQPVHSDACSDAVLGAMSLTGELAGLPEEVWAGYQASIAAPNEDPDRPFGAYAVAARKRRKGGCPVAHAVR